MTETKKDQLIIKTRKAVDEILDTTGEMTRTIKLTEEQVGKIDELAFRIRAILAKLSEK